MGLVSELSDYFQCIMDSLSASWTLSLHHGLSLSARVSMLTENCSEFLSCEWHTPGWFSLLYVLLFR